MRTFYRAFENQREDCRRAKVVEMDQDGTVRSETVEDCSRRQAVLRFLATLDPADVYAVTDTPPPPMSRRPGRTVVYFRRPGEGATL